jgi:RNA polymerase sigma-70 factor (ECF subfamily)
MNEPQQWNDVQLIAKLRSGDPAAFSEVYHRQQAPLYRYALHMSGSPAVAEDVVQDTFLTLMDKASEVDSARGSLASYLYGIARKLLARHFERAGRQRPLQPPQQSCVPEPLIDRDDPALVYRRAERIEAVRLAVLSLPTRYREAVVLCELQELDYTQAAARAGCTVGTIRSRLHRARALLAAKLRAPERQPARLKPKGCTA